MARYHGIGKKIRNVDYDNLEKDIGYISLLVFLLLASLFVIGFSISLFSVSMATHFMIETLGDCTMDNCVNTASECEIRTCTSTGDCIVAFTIPGCCDPTVNCTEQSSTANYAFDTICYSELGTCQPSIESGIQSLPTDEISIDDESTTLAEVSHENVELRIIGTSTKISGYVRKLDKQKLAIFYIEPWNISVDNSRISTYIGDISQEVFPKELSYSHKVDIPISIEYNGQRIPGSMTIYDNGSIQWFWFDGKSMRDIFDCNCSIEGYFLHYFFV